MLYIDLLSELGRREKEAGIFPEAEVDLFMKVKNGIYLDLVTACSALCFVFS